MGVGGAVLIQAGSSSTGSGIWCRQFPGSGDAQSREKTEPVTDIKPHNSQGKGKHQECSRRLNLTLQRENLLGPNIVRIDRLELCINSMSGDAWLFLVGGMNCLVHPVK